VLRAAARVTGLKPVVAARAAESRPLVAVSLESVVGVGASMAGAGVGHRCWTGSGPAMQVGEVTVAPLGALGEGGDCRGLGDGGVAAVDGGELEEGAVLGEADVLDLVAMRTKMSTSRWSQADLG
jgi:hypothetical protein